ncbi:hypothetical protein [Halococcus agarilyticus]|uniref:hypothetical protein n=1 Tax=Halococcus agarilyticus TaxID=1232219 RepID=UPI0006780E6E|nr:hypothetical protein [Halococcus agarilyticus]
MLASTLIVDGTLYDLGASTVAATDPEVDTPSDNVVPAVATVYVDRRLTLGENERTAHSELEDVVSTVVDEYGDDVALTIDEFADGYR